MHVWETRSCRIVLSAERMFREEIDMVSDNHQVADSELRVHTTSRIGYEKCLDAQLIHHTDREGDLLHGITFIEMEASLHGKDIDAA